jgi:ABC-type sugar transport system ATPase subunit
VDVPAVAFEGITRRFPGALALDGVTLRVAAGSCHALCGENGAGKSTLGRILAGILAPDAGRVLLHGEAVRFRGPREARAAGVAMVHQELAFCENLTVAENLCLAALPARRGLLARGEMERRAAAMLAEIGADLDVRRAVGALPVAHRQLVQIAAAVGAGARVIVFDEPTSALSQADAERLYALIGRLKAGGVTSLYVSHRMPEIFRLCDAVSVLRDGRHVDTLPVAGLREEELTRRMIGRPLAAFAAAHAGAAPGPELLRVEGLTSPGRFHDVSLTLHAGEVVGLAGLVGAGRSELAAALFGLDPRARGEVFVAGRPARIRTPADAVRAGIGLVPEDRQRQGLVLGAGAAANVTLPFLRRLARLGWLRRRRERAVAGEHLAAVRFRAGSPDAPVASLSGGNQQKVLLARWLAAGSRILLLDEPTRGVDVGAKAEIHALVDRLAGEGAAVLLVSSELPELLAVSRRILVLRGGRLVGELARGEATEERLLRLMAGLADAAPAPAAPPTTTIPIPHPS